MHTLFPSIIRRDPQSIYDSYVEHSHNKKTLNVTNFYTPVKNPLSCFLEVSRCEFLIGLPFVDIHASLQQQVHELLRDMLSLVP